MPSSRTARLTQGWFEDMAQVFQRSLQTCLDATIDSVSRNEFHQVIGATANVHGAAQTPVAVPRNATELAVGSVVSVANYGTLDSPQWAMLSSGVIGGVLSPPRSVVFSEDSGGYSGGDFLLGDPTRAHFFFDDSEGIFYGLTGPSQATFGIDPADSQMWIGDRAGLHMLWTLTGEGNCQFKSGDTVLWGATGTTRTIYGLEQIGNVLGPSIDVGLQSVLDAEGNSVVVNGIRCRDYNGTYWFSLLSGVAGGTGNIQFHIGREGSTHYIDYDDTTGLVDIAGTLRVQGGIIEGPLSLAANSGIFQGTGTFNTPDTGLKLYSANSTAKIESWANGTLQWKTDEATGKLVAADGTLHLGDEGLIIDAEDWHNYYIAWRHGDANVLDLDAALDSDNQLVNSYVYSRGDPTYINALLRLAAVANDGTTGYLGIYAYDANNSLAVVSCDEVSLQAGKAFVREMDGGFYTNQVLFTVCGLSAHTADLQRWELPESTVLAGVKASGALYFNDVTRERLPVAAAEFYGSHANANPPWVGAAVSTGTATTRTGDGAHAGVVGARSSTDANSGYTWSTHTDAMLLAGGEKFECVFKPITTTNTTTRIGFMSGFADTAPLDGVWLNIAGTTLSGKTNDNNTASTTGTTYTISGSTWYRGRIVVNADATRVDFYLYTADGTQVWTDNLTTNIPKTNGRQVGHGLVTSNSGTSANDLVDVDYLAMWAARDLVR